MKCDFEECINSSYCKHKDMPQCCSLYRDFKKKLNSEAVEEFAKLVTKNLAKV